VKLYPVFHSDRLAQNLACRLVEAVASVRLAFQEENVIVKHFCSSGEKGISRSGMLSSQLVKLSRWAAGPSTDRWFSPPPGVNGQGSRVRARSS
jgi:hypothetical protein